MTCVVRAKIGVARGDGDAPMMLGAEIGAARAVGALIRLSRGDSAVMWVCISTI